jgi:LmbE family N-acetylglucosaminyl deacetylase
MVMKILAIGSMPFDLELGCFGTLSHYVKQGDQAEIIIAGDKAEWTQKKIRAMNKSSRDIGISEVHFTANFDYSAITQANVLILRSFIETINPSLLFIPFRKAFNAKRRLLAESSLIAYHGIGNILMYEIDKNASFIPNVYFMLSSHASSVKISCLSAYDSDEDWRKTMKRKMTSLYKTYPQSADSNMPVEAFECHRILLLDHWFC